MKDRPDNVVELRARALRLLARREHSRQELRSKLVAGAESSTTLDVVVSRLENQRQLSEERYAEARARQLSRKYGVARIRQDLKSKGIAPEVIDRLALDDELGRARAILERKYRSPAATREERARRMRFLQSRGFGHELIRKALGAADDAEV